MFRALIELLITILVVLVARAVLTSVLRGIANASHGAFRNNQGSTSPGQAQDASSAPHKGSELHKDPVCGTYVVESTPFRRQTAGQTFYYCSEACREKHALVAAH